MANVITKQHVPVFISSTYDDMISYRQEVDRVLTRLQQTVKGMEYFGSSPKTPLQTCVEHLSESKIYICIIGMKYGSLNDEMNKSYTQIEYEEAVKNNIPVLVYIINEDHPIPPKFVDTGENAMKLQEFKAHLKKTHVVSFFSSPQDLGNKISNDLPSVLSKLGQVRIEDVSVKGSVDLVSEIEHFWQRPKKYNGYECILTMKIIEKEETMLRTPLATALGLEVGNSLEVSVLVVDAQNPDVTLWKTPISLCAEAEGADWLEQLPVNTLVEAKIRFAFATIPDITPHDNGKLMQTLTYKKFILIIDGTENIKD